MSATKRFGTFLQGKDIRDSESNDAVYMEMHWVNLSSRATIETDLDKIAGVIATAADDTATQTAYADVGSLSDPDATTGKRTLTLDTGTGVGLHSVILFGTYEGA